MNENVESSEQVNDDSQQPQENQETSSTVEVSQNAKNMALLCHLLGFFTCFIGPLIIWLLKKDEDSFIESQSKEALNFQITVAIAGIASSLLTFICIGALLLPVVGILDMVFSIVACVKSSKGIDYRYPVSIRLVK